LNNLAGFIMTVEKLNDRMGKLVAFLVYPTMLVLV